MQGRVGKAFHFDGPSYLTVRDDPSLDVTAQHTIAMWVRYDSISAFQGLLAKRGPASDEASNVTEPAAPGGFSFANYGINVQAHFGLGYYFDDPTFIRSGR